MRGRGLGDGGGSGGGGGGVRSDTYTSFAPCRVEILDRTPYTKSIASPEGLAHNSTIDFTQ